VGWVVGKGREGGRGWGVVGGWVGWGVCSLTGFAAYNVCIISLLMRKRLQI